MSGTTEEGGELDGVGGESRDLGPTAAPVVSDSATVDGDGGREVKRRLLYCLITFALSPCVYLLILSHFSTSQSDNSSGRY